MQEYLSTLVETALSSGASAACLIEPGELVVEEKLANYCADPGCPNYGLSPSCPPHVEGPAAFRAWRDAALCGLALRIDVPVAFLHSEERRDVMRLLHEIVARVETAAIGCGFPGSRGFAGGSCKHLFCREHDGCLRLSNTRRCRNPREARPSMSGYGINVGKMMEAAGWSGKMLAESRELGEEMSWVAGLVLVSREKGEEKHRPGPPGFR